MKDEIVSALQKERERTATELASLDAALAALRNGAAPRVPAPDRGSRRVKAPSGELTSAILQAVRRGPKTNGEIRAALKRNGYPFSLDPMHISKTLQRLSKTGQLKGDGSRKARVYRIARG